MWFLCFCAVAPKLQCLGWECGDPAYAVAQLDGDRGVVILV